MHYDRKFRFTYIITFLWNSFPNAVVSADTVNKVKVKKVQVKKLQQSLSPPFAGAGDANFGLLEFIYRN